MIENEADLFNDAYKEIATYTLRCNCGETHYWDDGVITTEPTHISLGVKTYTCLGCGTTKTEDVAKLTAHTYGDWQKYSDEQHMKTCECGDIQYTDHNWDDGVITLQPTHTAFGERTFTCADCSATKTEQVDKTMTHAYGAWVKVDDENHQRECACGEIETEAHNWDEGMITTEPTHMTFGVRTYTCWDCSATKTEQVVKTTEHSYGDWVAVDAETHTRSCACDDVETASHNWDEGVVTLHPIHTAFGERTHTCADCSATKTEQIAKLPEHSYGEWSKVDDDTHSRICACGEIQTEVHNWDDGVVTVQPTHTTFGEREHTCVDCSATKTEQIEKITGHSYGSWTQADAETHQRTCSCGNVEIENHNWNGGMITISPTHTTYGERTYTCEDCSATRKEQIANIPEHSYSSWGWSDANSHCRICHVCNDVETETHSWDNGKITVEPTHTTYGEYTYTCVDCFAIKIEQVDKTTLDCLGDVNGDGVLNTTDAREVLCYIVGINEFTNEQIEIADYDQDGKVTSSDVRKILLAVIA